MRSRVASFVHGFLLPFSLIFATLRDRALGRVYLKVTCLRAVAVVLIATCAIATSRGPSEERQRGFHVKIDDAGRERMTSALRGVHLPGVELDEQSAEDVVEAVEALDEGSTPPPSSIERGWKWIAWLVGLISLSEAIVVAVSRRWDDWLGFHAAGLVRTIPEDPEPKDPKLVFFDRSWLWKKFKRRIRGYAVIAAGIPFFALATFVPFIGDVVVTIGITAWSWYWLTIFAAAKSAHAWVDDGRAPSPLLIRELQSSLSPSRWLGPIRLYLRFWAWVTRGLNAPAMTVERAPARFVGLAVARAILSLPGLYLLARPLVPVAAGRLCAETDPFDRFSVRANEASASEAETLVRRAA